MKVILQKDIPNLGESGDIKDVSNGYARNFLIPRKLVLMADDTSKKAAEHQKRLIKIKKDKRRKQSEKIVEAIRGIELKFTAPAGDEGKLFGSITSMDIMKKLKEAGHDIDKRRINLQAPIKEIGTYEVTIKLDDGLHAEVKVLVEKE